MLTAIAHNTDIRLDESARERASEPYQGDQRGGEAERGEVGLQIARWSVCEWLCGERERDQALQSLET